MIYEASTLAVVIFFAFVAFTLGLSFYLGGKAKSSEGYFAAHGQIPWFVNGVAFAGDYLSAASFLGICGMIAFSGYDGFLYSIGFLAGWIVALFVIAEPMKRLGKFTFADALDAKFQSKGVKLAAGISTLAVSVFYLIPQMVGAGVLVQPLLGFPHWVGVVIVGSVVILIVVTAGMVSTTWVQFLKGSLLVIFSTVLVVMLLARGYEVKQGGNDEYEFKTLTAVEQEDGALSIEGYEVLAPGGEWGGSNFVQLSPAGSDQVLVFSQADASEGEVLLREAQTVTMTNDGQKLVNGKPQSAENDLHPVGRVSKLPEGKEESGPLDLLSFFSTLQESEVVLWRSEKITNEDGGSTTVYYQKPTPGAQVLRPGEHPKFAGIRSDKFSNKLNFLSLMLALFCGTASLPHILIRYYTVKDGASARKSTIVGIASIGFFYVLTLYMGLGAMTSGAMDVTSSNMAAPLLAKSMADWLFAVISAIAFTTVLGTVSGLILASAGAVAHDLAGVVLKEKLNDAELVRIAKITSVIVGAIAIVLGILFEKMNVGFLVGWAFSVAASANLPSLVMLLFWKKTTKQGITAAVLVGMISSLGWILLSGDTFKSVYGIDPETSPVPFDQPGIVTIPLGFLTLWVVSLMTQPKEEVSAA
ncbi:MAG: cation acetate symporter [Planctomycetaceae bacterium]|nr:cation acetate symporter [Planctomycetaceae bacterium]